MAEPSQAPSSEAAKPSASSGEAYRSPIALVVSGLGVLVVACVLAAAFNIFFENQAEYFEQNNVAYIVTLYLLFGIPTLLCAFAIVLLLAGAVRWAIYGRGGRLMEVRARQRDILESMNDRLLLSDTAKRIAYRHEDIALLRKTIQDDIRKHDFDAALVLVQEIGQTYGYVEEAEAYREQIIELRRAEIDEKVGEAVKKLDELLEKHEFESAMAEARKVQRMYPESAKGRELPERVNRGREQYKADLKREFTDAVNRDDTEEAWALLGTLDKYLTEQEAEPLRETARGVIGKHRENLGARYLMARNDKEWIAALRVGQEIIRQFPNSRMADEVRGELDAIRERAAGQSAAVATPPAPVPAPPPPRDPESRTRATDTNGQPSA